MTKVRYANICSRYQHSRTLRVARIVPSDLACFPAVFIIDKRTDIQYYWLTNLDTGECLNVNAGTVERVLSVNISYIDWVLKTDGKFENGTWHVQSKVVAR